MCESEGTVDPLNDGSHQIRYDRVRNRFMNSVGYQRAVAKLPKIFSTNSARILCTDCGRSKEIAEPVGEGCDPT
jgi:hypothetical protein